MKSAKKTLVFIPLLFIMLRVWATIQYFYTVYLTNTALIVKDGYCVPSYLKKVHVVLGVFQVLLAMPINWDHFILLKPLQAIGGGGQGWANCVLYVFMSSALHNRLFKTCKRFYYNILYHCNKAPPNEQVSSFFIPSYESVTTDTMAKSLEKEWIG